MGKDDVTPFNKVGNKTKLSTKGKATLMVDGTLDIPNKGIATTKAIIRKSTSANATIWPSGN